MEPNLTPTETEMAYSDIRGWPVLPIGSKCFLLGRNAPFLPVNAQYQVNGLLADPAHVGLYKKIFTITLFYSWFFDLQVYEVLCDITEIG